MKQYMNTLFVYLNNVMKTVLFVLFLFILFFRFFTLLAIRISRLYMCNILK